METEGKKGKLAGLWVDDAAFESVSFAAIFLWAASILAVEVAGLSRGQGWWDGWAVFFLGLGIVMILAAVVRRVAMGRRIEGFGAVGGLVLVAVGVDGLLSFAWIWPIVLLVIGALFLVSALTRPRLEGDVMEWDCC